MERDANIQSIIRRLQAIPGIRDLQEMHDNAESSEKHLKALWAEDELLEDALVLLQEEVN